MQHIRKAADCGDARAEFLYRIALIQRDGVNIDVEEGTEHVRKAPSQRNEPALL
jgi:hypothetical protein